MRRLLLATACAAALAPGAVAQEPGDQTTVLDSIAVEGIRRVSRASVVATANIPLGQPISFRDIQRAMEALYATRQFEDVGVFQGTVDGKEILRFSLVEHPLLTGWTVRGVEKLSERKVRGRVRLLDGRPYDPAAGARSRAAIDSLYEHEGYHLTEVVLRERAQVDGSLRVIFDVTEGRRVKVSQVIVEGNAHFSDGDVSGAMKTRPEGFWWFRKGEYNDDEIERDVRERLPAYYAEHGYIDFQVLDDTLLVREGTGKGTLVLRVDEGEQYEVGSFEITGNRHFSLEQLEQLSPFGKRGTGFLGMGGPSSEAPTFDQAQWQDATEQVRTLYMNNGYIYAQVTPLMTRRTTADGRNVVDLRWQIVERQPAIVNKVLIRGNTITHEDVVRRAILMVPGDVIRQDALIRSYQNISNLNFFEQPLPTPTTEQANQQGDVNVIFHVQDRHTGSINFGASVGQGTGLGGFIGMSEPNLFGRAKQISVQWQFGRNINDFNVSYTDPSLRGSFVSGTVTLHSSRLRFTVGDLGRIRSRGGSVRVGFPLGRSRFTRVFLSYTLEQSEYDSPTLTSRFICENCILSSTALSLVRDTRIDLPFPSGGVLHRFTVAQNGGPLGGSGNFRRATFEGRWYAPLVELGSQEALSSPMKVLLGLGAQTGFVWGDVGPHFRQLFSMGGTQFGIPLRGYDEFSVTPAGFDPLAQGQRASTVDAFGGSYFVLNGEVGLRLSQAIYLNTFINAGNVWATPQQFNPTRLLRGAGIGLSLITPLGPIGLDYAYGFDRLDRDGNPDPGWKFHFRLGQFF